MSDDITVGVVYFNRQPYAIDGRVKTVTYDQIIKLCKVPIGSSVVFMKTKFGKEDFKAGIVDPGQSIDLIDGLNISAMVVVDPA